MFVNLNRGTNIDYWKPGYGPGPIEVELAHITSNPRPSSFLKHSHCPLDVSMLIHVPLGGMVDLPITQFAQWLTTINHHDKMQVSSLARSVDCCGSQKRKQPYHRGPQRVSAGRERELVKRQRLHLRAG